jgi:hypothetical protein
VPLVRGAALRAAYLSERVAVWRRELAAATGARARALAGWIGEAEAGL